MKTSFFVKVRNYIDGILKFPYLKKDGTSVQVGFDLSSQRLTSDLIVMAKKVGKGGNIIAIDPTPANHKKIKQVIDDTFPTIKLIQCGTYDKKNVSQLLITERDSHNIVDNLDNGVYKKRSNQQLEIELDTLDNILEENDIDIQSINHINITNNGAEYKTIAGMKNILSSAQNLTITVIAGRSDNLGVEDDKVDHIEIKNLLEEYGFNAKFYRQGKLFWWAIIHQLILKRKWVVGNEKYFGVVIAAKGKNKIKWYQSYS